MVMVYKFERPKTTFHMGVACTIDNPYKGAKTTEWTNISVLVKGEIISGALPYGAGYKLYKNPFA